MQVRDFFWGGSGWFLLPHSLAVIIETMSCWPTGVWHSLLFLSGSPHAARWPDCIRRILPCFWSERRAFGEQECAGSFPASSPSHVEERPSRASTWTCGRCCSCASSSAWAPGTKVSADKGPHSPTVRLDPLWWIQDDEIIGQLYLFFFLFFSFLEWWESRGQQQDFRWEKFRWVFCAWCVWGLFSSPLVSGEPRVCLRGGGGERGECSVHAGDVSLHRARSVQPWLFHLFLL